MAAVGGSGAGVGLTLGAVRGGRAGVDGRGGRGRGAQRASGSTAGAELRAAAGGREICRDRQAGLPGEPVVGTEPVSAGPDADAAGPGGTDPPGAGEGAAADGGSIGACAERRHGAVAAAGVPPVAGGRGAVGDGAGAAYRQVRGGGGGSIAARDRGEWRVPLAGRRELSGDRRSGRSGALARAVDGEARRRSPGAARSGRNRHARSGSAGGSDARLRDAGDGGAGGRGRRGGAGGGAGAADGPAGGGARGGDPGRRHAGGADGGALRAGVPAEGGGGAEPGSSDAWGEAGFLRAVRLGGVGAGEPGPGKLCGGQRVPDGAGVASPERRVAGAVPGMGRIRGGGTGWQRRRIGASGWRRAGCAC